MSAPTRPRLQHQICQIARPSLIAGLILGLIACANPLSGGGYNPSTVTADFNATLYAESEIKNVVITNINLGAPSRNYLEKEATQIDGRISSYLRNNGFNVLPQREFSQRWNNAVSVYGDPVDPTTGRVNMKTFVQLMQTVRDQMREQTNVDAFVFTDLIELDVVFEQGVNRIVRFDGVTRKPALQGAGSGVNADFDWGRSVTAASIQISMYNIDLEKVFLGRGGIELTEAVDTRSGSSFVRRRDILNNEDFIDEGIALALHPLIPMAKWPGTVPE
jgi:hypothetical protein